jgi:hypothetical protein
MTTIFGENPFTDFLESNAICRLAGTLLPTPTLPASGEGANSSPACGGGWEGEECGFTFAKLS